VKTANAANAAIAANRKVAVAATFASAAMVVRLEIAPAKIAGAVIVARNSF